MKKRMITAILPLALLLTACGKAKTKINPNDYISINFGGTASSGTAEYTFDAKKMVEDNPEAFGLKSGYSQTELDGVVGKLTSAGIGKLSKSEGVTNGEEVSFSWDENVLKSLEGDYSIKWDGASTYKVTVENLPDLVEVNPFDYVEPLYEGESPHISFGCDYNKFEEKYYDLYQKVQKNSSNILTVGFQVVEDNSEHQTGDILTVKFSVWSRLDSVYTDDDVVELCKEAGYLITQTEKEYTIE